MSDRDIIEQFHERSNAVDHDSIFTEDSWQYLTDSSGGPGGVTESFQVSGVAWTGSPRLPLPSAVSICSIGSNGLQSVPSLHVTVPKRPKATSVLEDSDRQTNEVPANDSEDSIIRVPKEPTTVHKESSGRTNLSGVRLTPVRAPLEPTGGKNLVSKGFLITVTSWLERAKTTGPNIDIDDIEYNQPLV